MSSSTVLNLIWPNDNGYFEEGYFEFKARLKKKGLAIHCKSPAVSGHINLNLKSVQI